MCQRRDAPCSIGCDDGLAWMSGCAFSLVIVRRHDDDPPMANRYRRVDGWNRRAAAVGIAYIISNFHIQCTAVGTPASDDRFSGEALRSRTFVGLPRPPGARLVDS